MLDVFDVGGWKAKAKKAVDGDAEAGQAGVANDNAKGSINSIPRCICLEVELKSRQD
jgi:hypothetical protein